MRSRCFTEKLHDKAKIVGYLAGGHVVKAAPLIESDVLDGGRYFGPGLTVITDGTWAWLSSTVHYFKNYDFGLPAEFLAHIRAVSHRLPADMAQQAMILTFPRIGDWPSD
jgi:hypothetical protein